MNNPPQTLAEAMAQFGRAMEAAVQACGAAWRAQQERMVDAQARRAIEGGTDWRRTNEKRGGH